MNKHATMRLAKWSRLAAPVDPMDTHIRAQAQSILHGLVRDPLPDTAEQARAEQARDILQWHNTAQIQREGK